MDEEPCERREVERPARAQRASSGASARERSERLGGAVGKRALGLDVEDPDDRSTARSGIASSETTPGNAGT